MGPRPRPAALLSLALLAAIAAAALLAPAALAQPLPRSAAAGSTTAPAGSPAAVICNAPDLTTLCRIIKAGGSGKGATRLRSTRYTDTIFAPVDSAFVKDAKKVADELELRSFELIYSSPQKADRLLENLIIPDQAISSKAFKDDAKFKSLLGQTLELDSALFTKQFYVKSEEISALVVQPDVDAGKAVLHKTDRVPVPDDFL